MAVGVLAGVVVAVLSVASQLSGLVDFSVQGAVLLVVGVSLTVPLFLSLGVAMAGLFPRLLDYFLYSSILLTPAMFPLLELAGIRLGAAGLISPVWGSMVLVTSVFEPVQSGVEIVSALVHLGVWNVLAWRAAARGFLRLSGVTGNVTAPRPGRRGRRRARKSLSASTEMGARVRVRAVAATADLRLMLREPATIEILISPLLVSLVLGRGLPWLVASDGPLLSEGGPLASLFSGQSSVVVAVAEAVRAHMDYVRSFALVLCSVLYGMLGGLLILDEKDEGVLPFLKTLPAPDYWYLLRRCRRLLVLFALVVGPVVAVGGLRHGSSDVFALSLLLDALTLPVFFLIMSIVAKSKLQGLAIAKVLNVFTVAPFLVAVLPGNWVWAAGVFPTAWGTLLRLHAHGVVEILSLLAGAGAASAVLLRWLYLRAKAV